jgi:hypothetical protein
MDQRIPKPIRPVLQEYIFLVGRELPGLVEACFLEGSIALGGFNERFSDVDFVAVLSRTATPTEVEGLRLVHRAIEKCHRQWKMMGSYLQADALGDTDGGGEPHWQYHGGRLHLQERFEVHSVEGWILKHHGIALMGPDPRALPFTVDWSVLIQGMRENLNSYWAGYTWSPKRILTLYSDWGIQWAVLGVLRQFYSFRESSITTKTRAGEYALAHLPPRWHPLIQEAINIRASKTTSAYHLRIARVIQTIGSLKYVIRVCNASFA